MWHDSLSTNELFETLESLLQRNDSNDSDLVRELRIHQLELEIQNRELREAQQQLAHSRTRYADLYDFSPMGYASLDENGRIDEINIAGGNLLGDTPHRLIGCALTDFIYDEDIAHFIDHLGRCRRTRRKGNIELRLRKRNGDSIDVQLFTMATQDVDRHSFQFRTALLNITSRKRAEDAVRHSQSELEERIAQRTEELTAERHQREEAQQFLNEASALLSASLDYEITLWSLARAAVPHLADACVVDILDDDLIRRVSVAHATPEREHLLWNPEKFPMNSSGTFGNCKAIRTGEPQIYADIRDAVQEAPDSDREYFQTLAEIGITSLMSVPLLVRGHTIGCIGLMLEHPERHYNDFDLALAEDLADRAAIALDNAILYTKEQEANRLKDEFLSRVSHELRTPLTPILGSIYKLRSSRPGDHDLQVALDLIERNTKAQARIIEDLLDISQITTGNVKLDRKPTDLLDVIQSSVDVVRPTTEALGIHLECSLDNSKRLVWCDRERIQQVVWNLLSNAIKFTSGGGTIRVSLENHAERARIRVSDTGVGIHAEFLPHVFDRFRQGGRFATRTHSGLGLGLSIVRYIVERHGGSVTAESAGEGRGATLTVDLPYSYLAEIA